MESTGPVPSEPVPSRPVLSEPVLAALSYWPVNREDPPPADLTVLPPFLDELFARWPWWDRAWRVTGVEPPRVAVEENGRARSSHAFTQVYVAGTVGRGDETLPLSARIWFAGGRLLRFEAKVGDAVIGPAAFPAGEPERYPFGALLHSLMTARDVSAGELARRTGRARSTIAAVLGGYRPPPRSLVEEIAAALGIPEADLLAASGPDRLAPPPHHRLSSRGSP
ncbi:helix-turn-helix transcriptional regulator [Actinoplanes sp. NPDC023801]|uniref:helix-turn-helix domain-containing protein n=1 Tax=Actinoplanes sp. NPDC023801 TaxID=3154595 RepID=UPI0033C7512A